MSEVVNNAKKIIEPVIEALGYETVEISYKKQYGEMNLTVAIWKKGGVTLDDCEKVNDALDKVLEENDISLGESYNLNISSSGLDRPIITDDDFRRSLDTEIEVKKTSAKKSVHGILTAYSLDFITLKIKDKDTELERKNLVYARPYINFK